jgi:hypothetical protein
VLQIKAIEKDALSREVFTSNLMRFSHVITNFAMTLDEFLSAKMNVPDDMVMTEILSPNRNLIVVPYPLTETLPDNRTPGHRHVPLIVGVGV